MSEIINGVPIGDLPGIESVPDDSMLVVEFLGKAYHMPGAVLRQMIQDVLDSMGDSVDDVTEARLTAAIETVLASGKYNGVSPSVEVLDEEDGTTVIHIIDAFGVKKYPVEVKGARNAVQYVEQELTEEQKAQARKNIGVGDASTVLFIATEETTYTEIKAAYDAGKVCFANNNGAMLTLVNINDTEAMFALQLDPNLGVYKKYTSDGGTDFGLIESNAVQYVEQSLSEEQKAQVRANINAALDNIYFVKFSDAKYDEIKAAYDAGKLCFVQYANFVTCYMTRATDEYFMFDSAIGADAALRLQIGSDGTNTYEIIHSSAIMYTAQSLTLAQKEQARKNIGAADAASASKAANAVIVELAGNHTDGYTALLDGEAAIGDTLNELAQAGNVVIGIASSEMTFWLSSGMVYRVPEGTIFRYGNAVVSHEYRSLGFEFYVQMEDNNLALFYQDDGWVGKAQPVHITFYLVSPDSEGKMIRYNGEMLAASDAYWLLFDSMYRSRPVFCYQENAVFYAEDDSKHKPDMYTPFYFNGTDFSFCCEQDGYAYTLLISTSGYTPTAKKTTPYITAESKADDLKAEDGTLMLLSAGEPIGEGVPIPTGDSNVFVGNYDTVTFTEIKAAHDAGKVCFVKSDGMPFCQLLGIDDSEAIFIREINDTTDYKVTFTSAGGKGFTLVDKNISNVYVSGLFSAKYADIKAAYEAGKACFITYGALLCTMTVFDAEKAEFVGMLTPHIGMKGTLYADGTYNFQYVHSNAVQTVEQSLTDAQKAQARKNIGAGEPVVNTVTSQLRKEFAVGYSEEEISNVTEWQTATSPSGFNARQRSCCYGNGYYVIAGTSGQMAYRTKETAWVKPAAFTSGVITGLAYGNGRFLAVDSNGGVFTAATPDATWEQVFTASGVIESVRYLNNRFVAVGDNGFFATSLDGKEWTQKTAFTTNTLIDSAYGDGWFIAVGASGSIFRSINLNDWLDVSIADFGDIRTALFTVNGFVIGGAGGKIAYSTDGKSWSMATNNTTSTVNWIRGFAYAEKRIYAVMYISTGGGEIWVSKDGGATWAVDRSVSGRLWCVAHGDGVFFTSGDGGAIYEMDLGIKWQNEEPDENAWYRFVATLSNGERIVSESYKSKGEKQKAVLYEAQELTDVQKAQARANIGALSTDDVDTVLQQAKDSGQFDGKDGYTPVKGVDYFDGEDGKTAYAYAQDGGYTGTEAEFAAKLASDSEPLVVTLSGNDTDGYTADKTVAEIYAARTAGRDVYMVGGSVTYQLSYLNGSFAAFSYTMASRNAIEIISVIMISGLAPTRIHQTIDDSYVKYTAQSLDEEYKLQARTNIGALGTGGGTITGALSINDKLTQGSPSGDASVASMNRFHSDLFVQGNGTAPNTPTVAGFYLGKSTSDENRHMDIVSGGDYSYIDFNKGGRGADFDARLLVNVASGWTDFTWGSHGDITQRVFNVNGSLRQNGTEVLTWGNAGTDSILPVRLRTYQDHNNAVSDPNLATETGFYYVNTATNRPPFSQSTNVDYRVLTTAYSDQWLQQIATDFRCGDMFLRRRENGTWTPWVRFATAGDLSGYLPLGGGLMTGSLKFQDSSLPQKSLEFVCGIDAFANGGEMGWQSKAEFLSGYALKSDIPTNYAKLKTYNDFVHDGNEITMVPDGYSQGSLYFNYRTGAGQQNGNINNYLFCNGKGGTAGVTLTADSFSGTAAKATADGNGRNIVSTYATKDEVVTAANGALKVTLSGNDTDGYSVDKTYAEIQTAWNAGRYVYVTNGAVVYNPSLVNVNLGFIFTYTRATGDGVEVWSVLVNNLGTKPTVVKKTITA